MKGRAKGRNIHNGPEERKVTVWSVSTNQTYEKLQVEGQQLWWEGGSPTCRKV